MNHQARAVACFKGLATGDAIGKQTETLPYGVIRNWYQDGISGFHGRPGDVIPRYAGKRYEWRIGETTDDTEQTIAVAKAILRERRVKHEAIGRELLECKKSVHPDLSIWAFQQLGDPGRIAAEGNGCGAAMRVAPVGVIYTPDKLEDLVRRAYECSVPTHGGQIAICAAAAVASAISAAIEGLPANEVLGIALNACKQAEAFRPAKQAVSLANTIESIHADLAGRKKLVIDEVAKEYFPDRTANIVGLAINLALLTGSAEETILFAANVGGDSDSVASIGGAIAGALRPETVNEEWFEIVNSVEQHDLVDLATSLVALRSAV